MSFTYFLVHWCNGSDLDEGKVTGPRCVEGRVVLEKRASRVYSYGIERDRIATADMMTCQLYN